MAVIGGAGYLYYQHLVSTPSQVTQEFDEHRYPEPRVQIKGFQFEGYYEDKRLIKIKADKFTIEKKKLGFFRFGMLNVAKLKDAVIDIYGESTKDAGTPVSKASRQTAGPSNMESQWPSGITFKDVFQKESLPSFQVKRISSILIEPICLNLHDEKSLITQITANTAIIRLKNRDILFTGDARVVSGSRILQTEKLIFLPEKVILRTEMPFSLNTPEKRIEGDHLKIDIFLQKY